MNREQAGAAKQQAIASGESKYDGMACKTCGGTLRYTTGSACVLCAKAHTRARQVAKPEQQRQYHKTWRNKNREYLREYPKDAKDAN